MNDQLNENQFMLLLTIRIFAFYFTVSYIAKYHENHEHKSLKTLFIVNNIFLWSLVVLYVYVLYVIYKSLRQNYLFIIILILRMVIGVLLLVFRKKPLNVLFVFIVNCVLIMFETLFAN